VNPDKFTTTELMQKETRATVELLNRLHISKKQMPEVDLKEVINTYCENLDPGKMYFTQPEVDEFINAIRTEFRFIFGSRKSNTGF
jgi:DNA-directed RNA polymerase subunit H (RpoH/RPB5)